MREGLWKAEGSGNDFIVGTGSWAERLEEDEKFIRRLCDRRRGIGADGVLALFGTDPGRLRLAYRNADASKASFCANGSRVAALAAFDLMGLSSPLLLMTEWKNFGVERTKEEITLHLPPPDDSGQILRLESGPDSFEGFFIRFGVPHFLIRFPAASLRSSSLAVKGLRLRSHPDLGPSGANISFYNLQKNGSLEIRSFERGVSREVLSCGSAMAAAAWRETATGENLALLPQSGDILSAHRSNTGLDLRGPARIIARIENFRLP